jgi:prepilin-type N-terminal cleavage/methylation domain-containing protein
MPILSVGRASRGQNGVTLIEMMIVVAIVGLIAGVSFPAVSSGLDTIRLISASDSLVSFFNGALNRAERRQEAIEITVASKANTLVLHSTEPGFERKLEMPAGVTIEAVLPPLPEETDGPRRFIVLPSATIPRIGIQIVNRKGARRIVRLDPLTGVPQIETPQTP